MFLTLLVGIDETLNKKLFCLVLAFIGIYRLYRFNVVRQEEIMAVNYLD